MKNHSQQPLIKVYEVESPNQREMAGQGEITSSGVTDHLPRGSPVDVLGGQDEN